MPKVLNQNEVDALLDMVQAAAGPTARQPQQLTPEQSDRRSTHAQLGFNVVSAENVSIFDFRLPERLSTEQAAALEVLHEVFARNVSASLSSYLRTVVEVRLISVEQFTYSEFTMSVPSPTLFNSLSCTPLSGNIVLEMNPSITFPFIDRLLGGGSVKPASISRPLTLIEQGLINTILSRILDQLEEAWRTIRPIAFRIVDSETNPMLLQIVAPTEPVILLSFEVVMGDHSGLFNVCIPYKVIEPIIEEFTHQDWFSLLAEEDSSRERAHLLGNLRQAEAELTVVLADVSIGLTDLLNLRVGDILDLDKPANSELLLAVEGEPAFYGTPGVFKKHHALVLSREVDHCREKDANEVEEASVISPAP